MDHNSVKGLIGKIGGGWGRLILELPTNKLIRQPFYKSNYSTVYTFLREQAIAAGKAVDPDEGKRLFYRGTDPSYAGPRIATGDEWWDSHLFAATSEADARLYGPSIQKYAMSADARVLEHTDAVYDEIAASVGRHKYVAIAKEAEKRGYDAVVFKDQGGVGTIFLREGVVRPAGSGIEPKRLVGRKRVAVPDRDGQEIARLDEQLANGTITPEEYDRLSEGILDDRIRAAIDAAGGTPDQTAFIALDRRLKEQGIVLKKGETEVGPLLRQGTINEEDARLIRAWLQGTPTDRAAKGDAEGFLYHITPPTNLDSILEDGLVPKQSFYGLAADMVPENMRRGRVFFADSIDRAVDLAPGGGDEFLALRVKATDVGEATPERLFTGSQYTFNGIDPRKLEILGGDDAWHPLLDTMGGAVDGIPAKLDWALKQEAKRWAINRTQQVMFDFTRTGRLSELMWFVSPFFQPFTEFFLAWPKIIKQNPALVGYAQHLARAASEGGLFREDEQTGEMVMPMTHFLGAAPLLAATTGGKLADSPGGGWELFSPVSSFNMFATNAYPYDFGGTEIPIPTPSFSPPVQWFLQYAIDKMPVNDDLKQDYMAWLTEFGEVDFTRPQDFAIPSWMRHALTGAVPSWFDDQTNSNIQRFVALDQEMWIQVHGSVEGWDREKAEERARGQSQAFGLMRAAISAFFPASPRISFPTAELEAEWDEVQAQYGPRALEVWAGVFNPDTGRFEGGLHPGSTRIALAKTMWDDEENPFPMPASEAAERILNSAGGKAFVERFPRWAFFIIPKEIREGEFDLGAFFRQVSEGRRIVRTPHQANVSEDVANGWNAYFAIKTQFDAWQEAHPDQTSGDPGYDRRKGIFDDQKKMLAEQFPGWEAAWTMTIETGVNPAVMQEARILVRSEEFTKTDGGKGLHDYMQMRDALERDMAEANVSNLDTKLAERLGFTERYQKQVNELKAAHPDFAMMYDYLGFDADLRSVVTKGQRALDDVAFRPGMVTDPDSEHGIWEADINPWWDEFEKRMDAPYDNVTSDDQRFKAYGELRDWQNTAYDRPDGINPMKLWWDTRNPEEQADYKASLANRSPIYWSRFDWEVAGVKQTAKQQQFWSDVDAARSEAFEREKTDPNFGVGEALDQIDRAVALAAEKNKGLQRQLDIINNWTYGLEQIVLHPGKGRPIIDTSGTREEWRDVFDASQTVHDYMNKYGMTGASDYDPDLKTYYHTIKGALEKYIKELKKDNPVFASQWEYLQDLSGPDLLIDTLMPESNYDMGVVDGGTAAGVAHVGGRKLKSDKGVTLAPRPLKSLEQAQRQLGVNVLGHVEESYRTREEQAQRRDAYEAGTGNLAAEPGTSDHERGIAVDITSSFLEANPEVRRWLVANGWEQTVADEPWHWVFTGGR
jgi:hypothetical protein